MIKCREDLYGTYVLNDGSGAVELYLEFINSFGINSRPMDFEQCALALEVCKVHGEHRALWVVHDLNALDPESKRLTLSDLKPRTSTEYEKVTESIFDLRDEFERGELFSKHKNKEKYYQVNTEVWVVSAMNNNNLYRKVEKEINWREESHGYLAAKTGFHWSTPVAEVINDESDCFLELCRVALRANGEIE